MPEPRSTYRRERPAPSTIPSVVDVLDARKWTQQAECAKPPNDRLTWVVERSGGIEHAGSVAKMLQVCALCPVRRPCLQDALSERRFSIVGVWGGTTQTERTRTRGEVIADLKAAATPMTFGRDRSGTVMTSKTDMHYTPWDAEVIAETIERLESTFAERYARWVKLAPQQLRAQRVYRDDYKRRRAEKGDDDGGKSDRSSAGARGAAQWPSW